MRPIHDMLSRCAGRDSWHMPGHKGIAPWPDDLYRLDTTETPLSDDLYAPDSGIATAQQLYARAIRAQRSIFLTNGSTQGLHVMIQLYCHESDTLLLPRSAHLSAVNGCVLGGVTPAWIPVRQLSDGYFYVAEEDVLSALDAHPNAKALLLTRPDYYGGCIPMERITAKAHAMGIRVIVDEAHGAHLPWSSEPPFDAGRCGADAWTVSVHKTLPGLTSSAVLNLRHEDDLPGAMRILRRQQTSSPSFLLMQSIDDARDWMDQFGGQRLSELKQMADDLRRKLNDTPYRDAHSLWHQTGYQYDATRLVIDAPQGGQALQDALQAIGIDAEMHDPRRVVLISTVMDDQARFDRLIHALKSIPADNTCMIDPIQGYDEMPPLVMSVRQGAMAETENIPITGSAGRIAAAAAGLYPPGIPLVCPGEMITERIAVLLASAGNRGRFGTEGDTIACVR